MACSVCTVSAALVTCDQCDLHLCGPCGSLRHQKGSLVKHNVQFRAVNYGHSPDIFGEACSLCRNRKSATFCNECEMKFCMECAQDFHKLGSAMKHNLAHVGNALPPSEPPPPPPPPPNKSRKRPARIGSAGSGSSGSSVSSASSHRESRHSSSVPVLKSTDVITLKLLAFGISVSTKELLQLAKKNERNPEDSIYICFDCANQLISIYQSKPKSKNSEKVNRMRTARSFSSLKCAVPDPIESKKLSLQFVNSRYTYDCLTATSAERTQIIVVSNQIEKLENTEFATKNVPNQIVFAAYAFKRGKIRWSSRWLVLRNFELEVHRSREMCLQGLPPINQIDLSGAPVDVAGPKQLVVVCPERNFVFKLGSEAERNILLTLLADAATSEEPAARVRRRAHEPRSGMSVDGRDVDSDEDDSDGSDAEPVSPNVASPSNSHSYSSRTNRGSSSSLHNFEVSSISTPIMYSHNLKEPWDNLKAPNSGSRTSVLKHSRKASASVVIGIVDRNEQLHEFEQCLLKSPKMSSYAQGATQFDGVVSKMLKQSDKVSTKINFIEESDQKAKQQYTPPPNDPVMTVFWLIDTIYRSMNSGAYFSRRLYVSRQIWRQRGARFTVYDTKLDAFENVKKSLEAAVVEKFGTDNCLSMLVLCESELRQIQNQLSQHLTYVHAPKKHKTLPRSKLGRFGKSIKVISHSMAKGVTRATTRGQKIFDNTDYINLVKDICEQCQILKRWLDGLETYPNPSPDVVETGRWIREIAEFLNVFAKIIIVDMKFCLSRYMKHCDKSLY